MAMGGISAGVAGARVSGGVVVAGVVPSAKSARESGVGTRLLTGATSVSVGVSTEKLGPLFTLAAAANPAPAVAALGSTDKGKAAPAGGVMLNAGDATEPVGAGLVSSVSSSSSPIDVVN
jgi:hypothetical protein